MSIAARADLGRLRRPRRRNRGDGAGLARTDLGAGEVPPPGPEDPTWDGSHLVSPAPAREPAPGARGVAGAGGGRWATVPVPDEFRGTTRQVCGLWPFAAGSSRPVVGVPLGFDIVTRTTVSCDPISWYRAGLIGNPSALLLGNPHLGKSSLAGRWMIGLSHRGIRPMVLGDTKGEHGQVVAALGGTVVRVGAGGGRINPLDPGAMGEAAREIGGKVGEELATEAIERATTMVSALVQLMTRAPLADYLESVLRTAITVLNQDPGYAVNLRELIRLIEAAAPDLHIAAFTRGDPDRYQQLVDPLLRSLTALVAGPLGAVFGDVTTARISVDSPAVCVDISRISKSDERLIAAVMLATWNEGFGAIEARNALVRAGLRAPVRTLVVLDEMWRPLRIGAGLPDRMDALTRLNRADGVGQAFIIHTLKDLQSMSNPEDKLKAMGFAERSGMIITAGLARSDLALLAQISPLSTREIDMVSRWRTPPSWVPRKVRDPWTGKLRVAPPPGLGKFLIKAGEGRAGIAVQLDLTEQEIDLHDTNALWEQ